MLSLYRLLKGRIAKLGEYYRTSDFGAILRHSKNYFTGALSVAALQVIALSVFTRLLSVEEYGIFQVTKTCYRVAIVIIPLNFYGAVSRYYYEEHSDYRDFFATSLSGAYFFALSFIIFILIFSTQVTKLLGLPHSLLPWLCAWTFLGIIFQTYLQIAIATKRSASLAIVQTLREGAGLLFGVLFVLFLTSNRYRGVIIGKAVAEGALALALLPFLFRWLKWRPKKQHFHFIMIFALPLLLHQLSHIILGQIDRLIINKLSGPSDAGLYSLAYNIGMIVSMASAATSKALVPDWFRLMKRKDYVRVDNAVDKVFRLNLIIAFGAILFSREMGSIIAGQEFRASLGLVPIIITGYVFHTIFQAYGRNISLSKKMIYLLLIGILASTLNVFLNIWLIPKSGYSAAAYTTAISFIFMGLSSWFVARIILDQRVTEIAIFFKPCAAYFVGVFGYYALLHFDLNAFVEMPCKLALFIAFGIIIGNKFDLIKIRDS